MTLLVALMTCHNRRQKTMESITRYYACNLPEGCDRQLVLVDDGSTDGTSESVQANFPEVIIEKGDGSLFWNRGMLCAWERALPLNPDFVLWLNDDTLLYPHALNNLLETALVMGSKMAQPCIVVGSTVNDAGKISYGGSIPASRFNRLTMRKVIPTDSAQHAVTMNGNCVLVPREVYGRIGLLDEIYQHAMGDNDYGFRAYKAGVPIWVMRGFAGSCNNDHGLAGSFNDVNLPFLTRWKKITSPKGLPFIPWMTICKRYAGPGWPLVLLFPYAKLIASSMSRFMTRFLKWPNNAKF